MHSAVAGKRNGACVPALLRSFPAGLPSSAAGRNPTWTRAGFSFPSGTRPTLGVNGRDHCVWIVADLPNTRSGRIMRRVIASISNFADVGDVTTLANPEIVDDIRHHVQSAKMTRGESPRELTEEEKKELAAFGHVD